MAVNDKQSDGHTHIRKWNIFKLYCACALRLTTHRKKSSHWLYQPILLRLCHSNNEELLQQSKTSAFPASSSPLRSSPCFFSCSYRLFLLHSFPHNHLTPPYVHRDFTARPMESEETAESQGASVLQMHQEMTQISTTDQKKSLTTAQVMMNSHYKKYLMTGWCPFGTTSDRLSSWRTFAIGPTRT